jgi:hypothetical protein
MLSTVWHTDLNYRMIDPLAGLRNHTDRQTDINNILTYIYVHTDKYTWLAITESIVIYIYTHTHMLRICYISFDTEDQAAAHLSEDQAR